MLEPTRLGYLQAMGVSSWLPREPLTHAPPRLPAEWPVLAQPPQEPETAAPPARENLSPGVEAPVIRRRPELVRPGRAVEAPVPPVVEPPVEPADTRSQVALEPFYLQLWLAGPCALLLELPEPGLESGMPVRRLLDDIVRAAGLPGLRLLADFRWPLNRNPQFDRSAQAAHLALQAFMQGRLEEQGVVSIGCFGPRAALLGEPVPEQAFELFLRELALDQLAPAWFCPELQSLMNEPAEKARLWALLRRVMRRWQERE